MAILHSGTNSVALAHDAAKAIGLIYINGVPRRNGGIVRVYKTTAEQPYYVITINERLTYSECTADEAITQVLQWVL